MNITSLSINRPSLVVVIYAVLLIVGSISYYLLSYELVPKFNPPTVAVTAVYPGASPQEVEDNVTRPIEEILSAISNTTRINATSQENFSLVRLELANGTDVDETLQDAQRRLATLSDQLPSGVQPVISRFDFDDLPVLRIGVSSDLDQDDLFVLVNEVVQPALAQVQDVGEVRILGGREKEVKVQVEPHRLKAHGLTILQVVGAIRSNNLDVPAGSLETEEKRVFVRLSGRFSNLQELQTLVVGKSRQGQPILLQDVAQVVEGHKAVKVITRINGEESLGIEVRKRSNANAVRLSAGIRDRLAELEERHSDKGLQFVIGADSSEFTLQAANAVTIDLMLAIFLVSVVMLLFLHSLRNAVIVLVSIPTSIISTLIVMLVMGYSLNLMTLLALSLAIGILVDDSIVVLENIYRHLEMGKDRMTSALEGRMEIGFTALSITLVDVVVFMPILFAEGIVADLFAQFSVVMITSTLMSLFVSFTLVPLIASRFSRLEKLSTTTVTGQLVTRFEGFINQMTQSMTDLLRWGLTNPLISLVLALVLFGASISLVLIGSIGTEFTRGGDRNEFILEVELPQGSTLEKTNRVSLEVERYLSRVPEVETIFTTVGLTSSGRIESNPYNISEFLVKLVDKEDRSISATQLARGIKRQLLSNIPDISASPIEINLIGLRDDGAVEVTLFGPDVEALKDISEDVKGILDDVPGTVEVKSSFRNGGIDLEMVIDHQKRSLMGINSDQVAGAIRTAINGQVAGKFLSDNDELDVRVQFEEGWRRKSDHLEAVEVINQRGTLISLAQFGEMRESSLPSRMERTNRSPSITIRSQVIGRTGGSVGREFQQEMAGLDLPDGVRYVFTGQLQRLFEGFQTLGIALAASIIFVYLILVALYNSYVYPFVVLFSIPMAVVGALLLLALTKESLNIFSIMGLIMLVGLVGKNAILVVDFTNKLRDQGKALTDALLEATALRFRPVLMTNLSMVIGLLPIAFASGAGSEWKNGLAIALIGGLSSSMFLSLILVPVVYAMLERATGANRPSENA